MAPQVTLYAHGGAPNPLKVGMLLEELGVEYEVKQMVFGDQSPNGVKSPEFVKINPNGRVPAIVDHTNNDHIVWESVAILLYVAERFGKNGADKKFIGDTLEERSIVWEWLFFQASGQGPSQGQVGWFRMYHPVKDLHPSVEERYVNETYRIYDVLEKQLEREGNFLVLGRLTAVDMAFYPWLHGAKVWINLDFSKLPKLDAYHARMEALTSTKNAYAKIAVPL